MSHPSFTWQAVRYVYVTPVTHLAGGALRTYATAITHQDKERLMEKSRTRVERTVIQLRSLLGGGIYLQDVHLAEPGFALRALGGDNDVISAYLDVRQRGTHVDRLVDLQRSGRRVCN